MKKIIILLVLIVPIICNAQLANQNPNEKCKYKEGEIVLISFDQMVSLWIFDSPNRPQDSINKRKELAYDFDTTEVKAIIVERFFIEQYGLGYYYINVFDKYNRQRTTPILSTGPNKGRFNAISERYIRKRPIIL